MSGVHVKRNYEHATEECEGRREDQNGSMYVNVEQQKENNRISNKIIRARMLVT